MTNEELLQHKRMRLFSRESVEEFKPVQRCYYRNGCLIVVSGPPGIEKHSCRPMKDIYQITTI